MNSKSLIISAIFMISFILIGCHTLVIHPKVQVADNSSQYYLIKVSDNCSECHNSNYFSENNIYFPANRIIDEVAPDTSIIGQPPIVIIYRNPPLPIPTINIPWWFDTPKETPSKYRKTIERPTTTDKTDLRNIGGRNETPRIIDIPLPAPTRNDPIINEPGKNDPIKKERERNDPVKKENVKDEPVRKDPVIIERVRTDVRTEPVRTEPVRIEPVRIEPVRIEPVRIEPVRTEPVRTEPTTTPVNNPPPADTKPQTEERNNNSDSNSRKTR